MEEKEKGLVTVSSRSRERLNVAVEQLRDKAALVDELFLDWVCDEFSDEQRAEFFQGVDSADLRIYERVMDLRPEQLQAVVNAWAKQMTAELARWQVADEMSSAVDELQEKAERRAVERSLSASNPVVTGVGHAFMKNETTGRCDRCDHIEEMHAR